MSDAQHILNSIAAIARGLGRAPSQSEFFALARISEHYVTKFFPSWNDAVRAAGLHPYTLNVRLGDGELLRDWGETVRRNRAIPSRRAHRHQGKYDIRTIERRFGVPGPCFRRSFAVLPTTSPNGPMSSHFSPFPLPLV